MAQMDLGKVQFTYDDFTPDQLAQLKGDKGDSGFAPKVQMSTNTSTLTIEVTDVDGMKSQSVEKGTAVYYDVTEPTTTDKVIWISDVI